MWSSVRSKVQIGLHMVQLMPLPSPKAIISCLIKIQTCFAFLVPACPGCPGKEAVERVARSRCYHYCTATCFTFFLIFVGNCGCIVRGGDIRARIAFWDWVIRRMYWMCSRYPTGTDTIQKSQGTKVCRYNWHSAGFLVWPFPMLKYKYISQIKYTEAILSNSTRKPLWFENSKMLIAV